MNCEHVVEEIQAHAIARIRSLDALRGCRVSLPILEPGGDVITVTVEQGPEPGLYQVTDGGRINGILFESSPAGPSAEDRRLVQSIAERSTLRFNDDKRVFYATAEDRTLGYWAFEVGRAIAAAGSILPQQRRIRRGRKMSNQIIRQVEEELQRQDLRKFIQGPRRIRGVMDIERRVALSYQTRREPLGDQDLVGDVFVIAADLSIADPMRPARDTVIAAHDLSARGDEPIIRIIHGVVGDDEGISAAREQAEPARQLIKSVASANGIEHYPWDDREGKAAFLAVTRRELTHGVSLRS